MHGRTVKISVAGNLIEGEASHRPAGSVVAHHHAMAVAGIGSLMNHESGVCLRHSCGEMLSVIRCQDQETRIHGSTEAQDAAREAQIRSSLLTDRQWKKAP